MVQKNILIILNIFVWFLILNEHTLKISPKWRHFGPPTLPWFSCYFDKLQNRDEWPGSSDNQG